MLGDGVHHDAEGQDVTAHDEDAEQELTGSKELTAKPAKQDLTGISQVLDVRVTLTHKANVVSGISGQ